MLTAPDFSSPTSNWTYLFLCFLLRFVGIFDLLSGNFEMGLCVTTDHRCNKSRWVLKLCGKTCTRQWGFSDASSEPEGWSENKNNSWIEISSWKSYFPDLVDLNSSCLLFSLASPQGVKVTLTVFTFKVWTFPRSALEWIWLRHSACSECHFILKHRNTSYNWSDKDKDKECHFILVVLQYILQLVGSRCRL